MNAEEVQVLIDETHEAWLASNAASRRAIEKGADGVQRFVSGDALREFRAARERFAEKDRLLQQVFLELAAR